MKKKLPKVNSRGTVRRGRPSLYRPSYCEAVKDFMGQGYSLSAFAGSIGCDRATIYEWEHSIPEFSEAISIARAKRVQRLEQELLRASDGPTVNALILALMNACPAEWRTKIAREIPRRVNVSRVTEHDATRIYREMTVLVNFRTP